MARPNMIRLTAAVAAAAALLSVAPAVAAEPAPASIPAVTAADRVIGRADAPVTVVEYASFTCSHCAAWTNDVMPAFKARYIDTGQVRLVFRDLPTAPAQVAATAAAISRCAAPGKFYDVARSLMAGQAAAFAAGDARQWYMDAIAATGRSQAEVEACLSDPATGQALQHDIAAAQAAGVNSTPTFFVNGRRVEDHSIETLAAAIDPLIKGR